MSTLRFPLLLIATLAGLATFADAGKDPHKIPDKNMPRVFTPTRSMSETPIYPWKRDIMATVFWVGEKPTPRNPTPNCASSWDMNWARNYGGYDNPDPKARNGYLPKGFTPKLNPFYIALPYNDIKTWYSHKSEARRVIPWYHREFRGQGRSVLKGRWVAIRYKGKTVYAQWEDCGPFTTDDWEYVFGNARPKTKENGGAGIDISPACRDFLKLDGNDLVDWRFVEVSEVPNGPWRRWGRNNHFVKLREMESEEMSKRVARFRNGSTDAWASEKPVLRGDG